MGTDLLPFDEVAALVATASVIGIFLLTPLYLSQRRDVQRLREWMLKNPEHATADLALSESRLDKTEVELERLYAERGEPVPGTDEHAETEVQAGRDTARHPARGDARHQRAAGARADHDGALRARAAPAAAPLRRAGPSSRAGWRRWRWRRSWPRRRDHRRPAGAARGRRAGQSPAVDPAGIEVAVLNTTSADGLGGQALEGRSRTPASCPGTVESFVRETDQTVVMYQRGQKRAAKRVARELGGGSAAGDPEDRPRGPGRAAPTADVVVILGQDRVGG